ncbi:MAG: (2Fe-2S)-binding protein [Arenicellales bacterium]|jgi:carbon-monoxide dehydrogenase small subunit|nr:(2Fe-2S)-binding protein [Arenicellales bacterium]MDP6947797.1 (2Fe-2S)-binding protein [Arenicellales bacterium]|tara:strand:+ start:218 stop:706 length:489 start_codon:yes stop_codon:yes gene_type:complete
MPLLHEIGFVLNGSPIRLSVPVTMTVLEMLRGPLNLTGTKYGCGEGECGACTVLVDGLSLNACILLAVECDGREITSIEGLAADPAAAGLRRAFVEAGAVQCGFCTPGMVVQGKYLLDTRPGADRAAIARGLEGNLCRCTGYRKVVDAIERAGTTPAEVADD